MPPQRWSPAVECIVIDCVLEKCAVILRACIHLAGALCVKRIACSVFDVETLMPFILRRTPLTGRSSCRSKELNLLRCYVVYCSAECPCSSTAQCAVRRKGSFPSSMCRRSKLLEACTGRRRSLAFLFPLLVEGLSRCEKNLKDKKHKDRFRESGGKIEPDDAPVVFVP